MTVPTGNVQVYVDNVLARTAALDGTGKVTFDSGAVPPGQHSMYAVYQGGNYAPMTSAPKVVTVDSGATPLPPAGIDLELSAGEVTYPNPFTVTVKVTGLG
jgi:hypothetical protein